MKVKTEEKKQTNGIKNTTSHHKLQSSKIRLDRINVEESINLQDSFWANRKQKSSKSSVAKRKSRKSEVILDRSNLDSSTSRKVPLKENELEHSKAKIRDFLNKRKNHKSQIILDRLSLDSPIFRKALLEYYGIRDCSVRLERLCDSKITENASPKRKLLPPKEKVRSKISWLPTSSSVLASSSAALTELDKYHEKNGIVPVVGRKVVRRQRTKSIFTNRANNKDDQPEDMDGLARSKCKLSEIQPKPQQSISGWDKMVTEFKERAALRKTSN